MTNLTYDEIRRLASNAQSRSGYMWRFNEGPGLMAAIALAESKGDPKAHNSKPPDNSYGLWQINMLGGMGPERRKQFKIKTNEELFNPEKNADAMIKILSQQGLKAWSTYKDGSYKQYEHGKVDLDTGPIGDKVEDAADAIPGAINAFGKTFSAAVINLGVLVVAVVLLILGVVILARGPVSQVAGKTVVGKVAKTAKKVS